ncbi:PspC domain-containing protein [Actinocrinis sp.]|uniref:ATP-binding protein n=1 Tax=Actinocrinis sp. TaxID=1920516 RepID=UPI002D3A65A4|nr:PspC domain-containing protein [Actinocrinis sp.]HZP50567.1 PspC domain-containing protein [Actinocrinis sp.]
MTPPLPEGTRRLYRSSERRLVGGVARGLSLHLGVDVWLLRLAFVLLVFVGGAGVVTYAAFWLFVPLGKVPQVDRSAPRPGARAAVAIAIAAEAVLVIGLGGTNNSGKWNVVLPVAAVVVGLGVLWRQADDAQRARWLRPHRFNPSSLLRGLLGSAVVLGGIAVLVSGGVPWNKAGRVLLAAGALVAGVLLIATPFLLRVLRDLSAERSERIRSQERAEVAALMHDSVLHTLTLIQRSSADPAEVARLARAQERDLRSWLYEGGPRPRSGGDVPPETFVQAIKAAVAEVEDRHGVQIEVVTVGDAPLDEHLGACVAATREAAVNAAKYAKGAPISVYAELEADGNRTRGAEVFVRDRGPGFELDTVATDRMGIRESIVGRMRRFGGEASIRTAPGEGTEVRIEWRRD